MSRFNNIKKIFGQNSTESETTETSNDDIEKNESSLKFILNYTKKRYIDSQLEGNIFVSASLGAFSSSLSFDVTLEEDLTVNESVNTSESDQQKQSTDEVEKLKVRERLIVQCVNKVLQNLIRRANSYKDNSYNSLVLSNGITISDPVFGTFSISLTLSASVESLLKSTPSA